MLQSEREFRLAKQAAADIESLARATWIMAASVSFIDGEWGQKELETFADMLQIMHDASKSKVVRDVAIFHAKDDRAVAIVEKGLKDWRGDLAKCGAALEKLPVSDAIRFIYWTRELGTRIALAQNKGGWFGGSNSVSDNQSKVILNTHLPLIGKKVMKELVKGPDVNPLINIDLWIEENGG